MTTIKSTMQEMGNAVSEVVAQIAAKWAAIQLVGSAAKGGPLGLLGGALFGGLAGGLTKGIFGGFRANGGPVMPGRSYIVGERGPEVITPRVPGTVIPNHSMGGGIQQSIVIHAQVASSMDVQTMMKEAAYHARTELRFTPTGG